MISCSSLMGWSNTRSLCCSSPISCAAAALGSCWSAASLLLELQKDSVFIVGLWRGHTCLLCFRVVLLGGYTPLAVLLLVSQHCFTPWLCLLGCLPHLLSQPVLAPGRPPDIYGPAFYLAPKLSAWDLLPNICLKPYLDTLFSIPETIHSSFTVALVLKLSGSVPETFCDCFVAQAWQTGTEWEKVTKNFRQYG